MKNGRLGRSRGLKRRGRPGGGELGCVENQRDGVERGVRSGVAQQAAVLVGAVLVVLGLECKALAQNQDAEE